MANGFTYSIYFLTLDEFIPPAMINGTSMFSLIFLKSFTSKDMPVPPGLSFVKASTSRASIPVEAYAFEAVMKLSVPESPLALILKT